MVEKFRGKSTQRSKLARVLLSRNADEGSLFSRLTPMDILLGFGVVFLLTWLLVGFQLQGLIRHQNIPDYNVGDIADRDIVAPYDFTVEDQEATFQKQDNTRKIVPAIFDLDLIGPRKLATPFPQQFHHDLGHAIGSSHLQMCKSELR